MVWYKIVVKFDELNNHNMNEIPLFMFRETEEIDSFDLDIKQLKDYKLVCLLIYYRVSNEIPRNPMCKFFHYPNYLHNFTVDLIKIKDEKTAMEVYKNYIDFMKQKEKEIQQEYGQKVKLNRPIGKKGFKFGRKVA